MQKDLQNYYIDQFKLLSVIHNNYQTTVYEATSEVTGIVAIKVFQKQKKSYFQTQSSILSELKFGIFPKVISVRNNCYLIKGQQKQKCHIIIMQYIKGGNLYEALKKYGRFSKLVAKKFFYELIFTIDHLHYRGIAHRDIKLGNIMLTENYQLKLIDFEFAIKVDPKNNIPNLSDVLGTRQYMAPQIFEEKYNAIQTDVFACGVVLFFMVAGCLPFHSSQEQDTIYNLIRTGNWKYFWSAHSQKQPLGLFTSNFKLLFEKLVCYDPNNRLSTKMILKHPWVVDRQLDGNLRVVQWFSQKEQQKKQSIFAQKGKNFKSNDCLKSIVF